jgi:hypothetical protein
MTLFVAVCQTLHYRTGRDVYGRMTQFWGKLMLISFAVGVVTGIVQEFQFVTDVYLLKVDSTGNLLWNRTYGGIGADDGYGLAATSDGELFVNDIVDSMKTVALDSEFIKDITGIEQDKNIGVHSERLKSFYEAERNSINSIYIFDDKGKILTHYPQEQTSTYAGLTSDVDIAINRKKTYIGRVYWDESKKGFILGIYEPIFDGSSF